MTAPAYNILDGDGGANQPRLPAEDCEDMGGLYFEDSVTHPPRSHEQMSALDFMQVERLVQRIMQTAPLVRIWATGGAVAPTVNAVRSMSANVASGSVTLGRTGVGVYTFTLAASALPSSPGHPSAQPIGAAWVQVVASQAGNVITVTMTDAAGVATDAGSFLLDIFGGA